MYDYGEGLTGTLPGVLRNGQQITVAAKCDHREVFEF